MRRYELNSGRVVSKRESTSAWTWRKGSSDMVGDWEDVCDLGWRDDCMQGSRGLAGPVKRLFKFAMDVTGCRDVYRCYCGGKLI